MTDLLVHDLKIVFCGTAKGKLSAQTGSFYAHPSNRFYKTLFDAGLTDHLLAPENFQHLLKYGIGLTDLNQTESGMDRSLSVDGFDIAGFYQKMLTFSPKIVAFTSLKAGRVYFGNRHISCGLQRQKLGTSLTCVLPSTSAANGHWTRDRHHWYQLAELLSET